ncbi:MAG: SIS domain-containing protein [Actinomycetota bacterium]|nr:SIS domain-containing protein [Actinomycetota bacterium]
MAPEQTDFLYPFIEGGERDSRSLLTDLAASAEAKAVESLRLRTKTMAATADQLQQAAEAMAARFIAGGRLFTFGNGGSSTDAATVADLFASPPDGTPLPALTLACDEAILTALGNDVGFDLVFSRQMIAHAHPGDMALGVSTSGNSRNVVLALEEATRREVLTFGLVGYDGGQMARSDLDHCFVVGSDSVHRIQETQAFLVFDLWRRVQAALRPKGNA